MSAERKSRSHSFFFWTLNLPWDLAAAQTGVFLGALLQEWPHEGRPSRQLPGRLSGERGRGEVSESVCSLACWLPWRVRGTLLWFSGCWGPCSQPKSSEKKKQKIPRCSCGSGQKMGVWSAEGVSASDTSVPNPSGRGGEADASPRGLAAMLLCGKPPSRRRPAMDATRATDDCSQTRPSARSAVALA